MDSKTRGSLSKRFAYALKSMNDSGGLYRAMIDDREIGLEPFGAAGFEVTPFAQDHGYGQTTLGFRIGGFAYSTDAVSLDDKAFSVLDGVDTWFVDCLQEKPHATHSHREQTFSWIEKVRPRRAVLMHMNHTLDYDTLAALCPSGVEPGYDGLAVEL